MRWRQFSRKRLVEQSRTWPRIAAVQESITGNLKALSTATTPIDQQIAQQIQHIADLNAQIAAAGDPATAADPQALIALYDELQQATVDLLACRSSRFRSSSTARWRR